MKIFLKKTLYGLAPANEEATELLKKIKLGSTVSCEIKRPRNYLFHQKFFVMLKMVFDNQEVFVTQDELLDRLKLDVGVVVQSKNWDGKISYHPGSISFAKMNQEKFELFYSNCIDCILMNLLTMTTRDEIDSQVEKLLRFA